MHLLTSNFNLLQSNSSWENLKKKNFHIDENFNNFFFQLNSTKNFHKYNSIHVILNFENNNKHILVKQIKYLKKKIDLTKIYFYVSFDVFNKNYLKFEKFLEKKINFKKDDLNLIILKKIKFNKRNKTHISFPYHSYAIEQLSKQIYIVFHSLQYKPYKLIVLDCDNTLWGGILDEDGKNKILYSNKGKGAIYKKFQQYLKMLKKKGFILSICSKNEAKRVWEAMKNKKMILQKKDFIYPKINWSAKDKNIREILSSLSLREEDALFVDDNIIEIERVKSTLKKINYLQFDKKNIINNIYKDLRLKKNKVLKEDKKKYYQYKLKSKFDELKEKQPEIKNNFNFLKSVNQKIKFLKCNSKNIDRCLQLIHKTNQFNISLKRYSKNDLLNILINKKYFLRLIHFKDKFGEHGIVGLFIIYTDTKEIIIKDFLLSCRVLFRKIEDFTISKISSIYPKKKILIEYKKTVVNNKLVPKFLTKSYFKLYKRKEKNLEIYKITNNNELNATKKIFH